MTRFVFLALASTALARPFYYKFLLWQDSQPAVAECAKHQIASEEYAVDSQTSSDDWTIEIPVPSDEWEAEADNMLDEWEIDAQTPVWDIDSVGQRAPGVCAVRTINNKDGIGNGADRYVQYSGNGTPQQGWPEKNKWVSFENMFNNYKSIMERSCAQWHVPNNSGPEIGAIYNAIQRVAAETQVDHRFILAIIMQESNGCVRAPTTNYGVRNPGLMQDHNGAATCNEGRVQFPCPENTITQMIRDGTGGTSSGDGLAGTLSQALRFGGAGNAATYYRAARIYNSGSVAGSGKLQDGIATHCYATDVANRLTGWVHARSGCRFDGH